MDIEAGEVTTEEPAVEQPAWTPEVEAEARDFGWKPAAEWRGELPPNYVEDPRAWMEKQEGTPAYRALSKRIAATNKEFEARLAKLDAAARRSEAAMEARHKAELEAIRQRKLEAVDSGDREAYTALQQQEEALTRPQEAPPSVPPEWQTALQKWIGERDWWESDPIMTAAAKVLHTEALSKGITDPEMNLAYVDRKIAERFDAKPGRKTPAVGGGLGFGAGAKKDAFAALPPEAQTQFRRDVARGIVTDDAAGRAEWARIYNEG